LTAYKALAFAVSARHSRVYIAGIDNSLFRTIQVDDKNRLLQLVNHYGQGYEGFSDFSALFPSGMYDYFASLSEDFRSLVNCFGKYKIVNLGINSEVDAFNKIVPSDPFYSLVSK
jgi:hypothetical protein